MEFRLLGPLELEGDHGVVPLGSGKQRALLAVLLLHANEQVSRERLIDALWGETPPASAAHSVDVYVSRLRKALHEAGANGVLATRGGGYLLHVDGEHYDAGRFERLLDEARAADSGEAAKLLRDALALWRGPPLVDVELEGSAGRSVARLEELRLLALEERIEADLTLGRHATMVGELQSLIDAHPFRERFRAQYIRALYGAGRQAEALEAYRDAHRTLAELGLVPSPELKALQRQILTHDPSLQASADRGGREPRRQRLRRPWAIAGGLALLIAAGAAVLTIGLTRDSGVASTVVGVNNSVGLFDPATERLVADIPIGGSPGYSYGRNLAVGLGSVWVTNLDDMTLIRIDPKKRAIARTVGLGGTPAAVAVGHGAVWVLLAPTTTLLKLDSLGNIVQRIRLRRRDALPPPPSHMSASVAPGPDAMWVVHGLASVAKIDPRTGRVLHDTISLGGVLPGEVVATRGTVWVAGLDQGLVVRLDPRTGEMLGKTQPAGGPLSFWSQLAEGADGLWTTDYSEDLVWRLNQATNRPDGSVTVDHYPVGIDIYRGSVWVASLDGTIDRIDPKTMQLTSRAEVGANPLNLVHGPGGIWVTFGPATP
jgi:DNA-binding SARP family transcriptional activator/DNA-binding beta-propeller fold protein YncE